MNIMIPILLILSVHGIRRYLSYYDQYSDQERKQHAVKLFLLIFFTTVIIYNTFI